MSREVPNVAALLVALLVLLGGGSVAFAESPPGIVELTVSPETEVVRFPRVEPARIDLALYGNRVELDRQLEGRSTFHLRQAWASTVGGGTWFVTLHVDDPQVDLGWSLEEGRLRLTLAPGEPALQAPYPSLVEPALLLDDPPPRRPAATPPLTLHPFLGDASTMRMTPEQAFRGMPRVRTVEVATYSSSMAAIDAYREMWATTDAVDVRGAALSRMAVAYANLDLDREALHYFHRALDMGRDDPELALAMAKTQVAMGRAGEARSSCRYAARRGADDDDVLACLGGAALLDGHPSPSHVGRALLASTADGHRRLLAAQLLQSDHRHDEALPILERLAEQGSPAVAASLGDARFATGDLRGAVEAWEGAARSRRYRNLAVLRVRMAEMLAEGPGSFPSAVPMLLERSDRGGAVGDEAHYLLAQIGAIHIDPDLVSEQLNQLWDESPERALASDVPERLVSTCATRMRYLRDRPVDALDFFARCWRSELDGLVTDPESLEVASRSMAALGLPDDALTLQLRATTLRTRGGEDDPAALAWLGELHLRTGRPEDALETVAYVRELDTYEEGRRAGTEESQRLEVQLALSEGQAHLDLERPEKALRAWARPASTLPGAGELAVRRGWLLAGLGRCDEALPLLDDRTESRLARARCLLALGRPAEAREAVAELADDTEVAPAVREDASWLSGVGGFAAGEGPPDPTVDEGGEPGRDVDAIWAALAEEEARARAFEEKRTKR